VKADHAKMARLIKTARGQLDGILKMIEDDRYCMDIYHQLLATRAILKKASNDVMQAHLESCVREALESGQEKEKITEIIDLINKMTQS
jgi:DNA-binding FrmR family transcriptional regulator